MPSDSNNNSNLSRVVFSNPGLLDLRLLSTFGASAKETSSPIGKFGTGLKFALATIMRLGGQVEIWIGTQRYEIVLVDEQIRDKTFKRLCLHSQYDSANLLPFTIDLGSHWLPWMAFRELWSNAKDEHGRMDVGHLVEDFVPHEDETAIIVTCEEILNCVMSLDQFVVSNSDDMLWGNSEVEILPRRDHAAVFYRGILVVEDLGSPHEFSYNVLTELSLTEDRTVQDLYGLKKILATAWLSCNNAAFCKVHSESHDGSVEFDLPYDQYDSSVSEEFYRAWLDRMISRSRIPAKIRSMLKNHRPQEYEQAQICQIDLTAEGLAEAEPPRSGPAPATYALSSAMYDVQRELDYQYRRDNFWHRAAIALLAQQKTISEAEDDAAVPF